jgi:rare lipoprotein A
MMRVLAATLLTLATLGGCARQPVRPPPPAATVEPGSLPRAEPRAALGNPPFYDVEGHRYFVLASAEGYVEQGVASWYGPDFHGLRTATGEPYDMRAMTGAHPTLPLPAWVQVTNLQNGRSAIVRLNDRGPFRKNRIIDLSQAAAEQLDMIRAGTALVEVRSLATAGAGIAPPAETRRFYAQAGAFADPDNAERLATRLRTLGLGPVAVVAVAVDGRHLHRVRVGPVGSVSEFDLLVERLRQAGIEAPRLALD